MSKVEVTKEVTEMKTVTVGYKCDTCGTQALTSNPKGWTVVTGSHEEWGRDSVDSEISYDCCSPDCFLESLEQCLIEFNDNKQTAEINGWSYQFTKEFLQHIKRIQ